MLHVYKEYFFKKDKIVENLKNGFKESEIVVLENTEPPSAIICHQKAKLADYIHTETRDGINKYLTRKIGYAEFSDKVKGELLNKTLKFGKFVLSKNKKMLPGLTLVFFVVLIEILLIWFLSSLPELSGKGSSFLIIGEYPIY